MTLSKLAAIDIGSNSIKLVVVDASAGDSFTILANEREVVRLGHETLVKKHLSESAIRRAVECIKGYKMTAEEFGTEKIVATATASVREADNSAEFIRVVEAETGVRVEVLSGEEEARLIGLAAAQGCTAKRVASLNIDIGGGSTELSIFRDGAPVTLLSVKLGAVGLTERFLKSDPPHSDELNSLRSEIRQTLEPAARKLRQQSWQQTTATSGTALTVGAALRASFGSEKTTDVRAFGAMDIRASGTSDIRGASDAAPEIRSVEGAGIIVTVSELARLNALLSSLSTLQRRSVAGLSPQRADIIVAGAFVLEEVMNALGIESLRTCDWSLREGVIIDRLRSWNASAASFRPEDPLREREQV